jgi:nitrogen regulatory protein PII
VCAAAGSLSKTNCSSLVSAIAAIKQSAQTDRKEDGKIFVKDLVEVIRIRTEERGERAI